MLMFVNTMYKKKNSFPSYVLLVLCVETAVAQFIGQQAQPFDLTRQRALSPQQQGHILSDIQQHRFNLAQQPQQQQQQQQNLQVAQQFQRPPPQPANIFNTNQQQFIQSNFQQQPQQPINNQQLLQNQQLQNAAHLTNPQFASSPSTLLGQINPTSNPNAFQSSQQRPVIQHHTQTSFTPTNSPQASNFNQKFPLGISDALLNVGPSNVQTQQQLDPEKQKQRLKELKEKQAIIDKHNQFVEKQYEKALKKAQSDHVDFIQSQQEHKKKLYQALYKTNNNFDTIRFAQTNPRFLYPEESDLFKAAVKKYYEDHPTTTTTTTTQKPITTTEKEKLKRLESELLLSSANSRLFNQIKSATEKSAIDDKQSIFLPTAVPTRKIQSLDDLSLLQKAYKNQQIKKDDLLSQLRLAIGENAEDELSKNITSREIQLPNGQRVQIIRTSDPKLIPGAKALDLSSFTTTTKAPTAILEELTKDVIPPGSNYELLKHGSSGLEQVGGLPQNLPNQKKVTFVLLEEQNDGSFKVQGVKGNGKEKSEVDIDSILKKIKDGEIKLPPNTKIQAPLSGASTTLRPTSSSTPIFSSTTNSIQSTESHLPSVSILPNSISPSTLDEFSSTPILKTNIGTHFVATSTPISSLSTNSVHSTTPRSIENYSSSKNLDETDSLRLNSAASHDLIRQASTASTLNQNSIFSSSFPSSLSPPKPTLPTYATTKHGVTIFETQSTSLPQLEQQDFSSRGRSELPDVLRHNGLYAMARFLHQSGLDTILNETGPYTIFAPTDKAFRTLLIQLGGPEKAEEKFKENPRLLSGLLLHHVIPGAFKIESLQDEMTGVSLAGTQLRVNQYNMHDLEWNDIKITTINGAKVMDDKRDIEIPQGIAHSIDRVMFPLPVGDIVQTLQSDRERRFTSFLRALFASGLAETLQGTKTFTLFAPTDRAFVGFTSEELTRTVSDKALARELVMRHLTPGTLYTNGMRYYQIRDSLEPNRQITFSKSSGRVKVNNNLIATQNIPSTNGVIHALDVLL